MPLLLLLILLGCIFFSSVTAAEQVSKSVDTAKLTIWKITEPTVTQKQTDYGNIVFKPRDIVVVDAGGCVQTGGHGATWKRYVNPSGSNSDRLYHGLIKMPGQAGLVRIIEFIANLTPYTISDSQGGDMILSLGYEDDVYDDNTYTKRDNGTEDQCKDTGPAWVNITIVHP
jgi:hypothetical protein